MRKTEESLGLIHALRLCNREPFRSLHSTALRPRVLNSIPSSMVRVLTICFTRAKGRLLAAPAVPLSVFFGLPWLFFHPDYTKRARQIVVRTGSEEKLVGLTVIGCPSAKFNPP